jgi:hypothetical protein
MSDIRSLVSDFVEGLSTVIEEQALDRARAHVAAALGAGIRGNAYRPRSLSLPGRKPRKKLPVQLCPVPGCKNPAAPIFGMVCAEHQDVSKAKIKKYREARRLAKKKGTSRGSTAKSALTKRKRRPKAATNAPARQPRRRRRVKSLPTKRAEKPVETPVAAVTPAPATS